MRPAYIAVAAAIVGVAVSQGRAADLHVPSTFTTIQAAIDAAAPGDRVLIADGVYAGPGNVDLDLAGKTLVIESVNGPAACILDGSSTPGANAFDLDSGEGPSTRIEGLTMQGFRTTAGDEGAIRVVGSAGQIKRCVFTDCATSAAPAATPPGSAIKLIDSSPVVRECTFTFNEGSALHTDADSVVYVIDSVFEDNVARVTDGRGGGRRAQRGVHPDVRLVLPPQPRDRVVGPGPRRGVRPYERFA
ncbi:MAG: hypothetical protein GY715_04095 [Planctomycetes bacterium]|nr:hypothetical protein [Planctomycetota bacterium]